MAMNKGVLGFAARGISALVATFALALPGSAGAAEVKLMIEPSYPPAKAAEVFKPLADYLSKTTGHKITLVTPKNYHFFGRDLRQNTPVDIVFEEPHFVDYQVKHFNFEPLAKTAEPTSYSLLASADQVKSATLDALLGRNIVTMPSPSLGYALLFEFYPNPVSQPNVLSTAVSWRDGMDAVFAGEVDAAIVPTWLKNQYPSNVVTIKTSRSFPGAAFVASDKLDPKIKQDIKVALLKLHESKDSMSVLTEIGTTKFVEATAAEYDGAQKMLKGIFGFQ